MGQYYVLVNETKKEYVYPWNLGGTKLWEWCVNPVAGVLPYLLRKVTASDWSESDQSAVQTRMYAGSWAGEHVYLVGDFDDGELYQKARESYQDITVPLAREYNRFVQVKKYQLRVPGSEDDETNPEAA